MSGAKEEEGHKRMWRQRVYCGEWLISDMEIIADDSIIDQCLSWLAGDAMRKWWQFWKPYQVLWRLQYVPVSPHRPLATSPPPMLTPTSS